MNSTHSEGILGSGIQLRSAQLQNCNNTAIQTEVNRELGGLTKALNSIQENLDSHSDRIKSIKCPAPKPDCDNKTPCPEEILSPLGEHLRQLRRHAECLVRQSNDISQDLAI